MEDFLKVLAIITTPFFLFFLIAPQSMWTDDVSVDTEKEVNEIIVIDTNEVIGADSITGDTFVIDYRW